MRMYDGGARPPLFAAISFYISYVSRALADAEGKNADADGAIKNSASQTQQLQLQHDHATKQLKVRVQAKLATCVLSV